MLVIRFKRDGSVEMAASGYPGQACHRVTSFFTRSMAGDVVSDVPTEEANEPEQGYVAVPNTETA